MRKKRLFIIALALMTVTCIHPQASMPTARAAEVTATATPSPTSNPQADALDMLRGTLDREPGVVRTQEENDTLLALTIGLSLTGFLLLIFSLSLALAIRPRLRRERAERIDEGIEDYGVDEEPMEAPRGKKKQRVLAATSADGGGKPAEELAIQPLQTSKPVLGTRIDLDAMSDSAGDGHAGGRAGNAEQRFKPPMDGDDGLEDALEDIPSAPLTQADPAMREAESRYIEDAFENNGAEQAGMDDAPSQEVVMDDFVASENKGTAQGQSGNDASPEPDAVPHVAPDAAPDRIDDSDEIAAQSLVIEDNEAVHPAPEAGPNEPADTTAQSAAAEMNANSTDINASELTPTEPISPTESEPLPRTVAPTSSTKKRSRKQRSG